jgi:hypothetical protein
MPPRFRMAKSGSTVKNLVTNETVPTKFAGDEMQFDLESGPVELNAFLIQ